MAIAIIIEIEGAGDAFIDAADAVVIDGIADLGRAVMHRRVQRLAVGAIGIAIVVIIRIDAMSDASPSKFAKPSSMPAVQLSSMPLQASVVPGCTRCCHHRSRCCRRQSRRAVQADCVTAGLPNPSTSASRYHVVGVHATTVTL